MTTTPQKSATRTRRRPAKKTGSALENKAMIVRLRCSTWAASITAKDLGAELAERHHAKPGTASVYKQLLSKQALKPVIRAINNARWFHRELTLPWNDDGDRLLPVKAHGLYTEALDKAIEAVNTTKAEFLAQYEELIEQARNDLGEMFDESDYPSLDKVKARFGVSYDIWPVPAASHFVADIGTEEADRIKRDIERRNQAKIDSAMVSMYERLQKAMSRLIERLGYDDDGKPKAIHATAVDHLRDIADTIPSLNLTDDMRLTEMAVEIKQALDGIEITDLRYTSRRDDAREQTDSIRKDLSTELESIASSYFGKAAS